jgi:Fe2+ or Zn2+ uptake regulation protein
VQIEPGVVEGQPMQSVIRTRTQWLKRKKNMTKEINRPLSKNQRKILDILRKYQELTARDIAEILWARDIGYKTPEYSSVHRSLTALYKRGLVLKVGGQLKWRRNKEIRQPSFSKKSR